MVMCRMPLVVKKKRRRKLEKKNMWWKNVVINSDRIWVIRNSFQMTGILQQK